MLNSCILTGNLGADPEIFYSSEGEPVATFNLAFRSSKKKTGPSGMYWLNNKFVYLSFWRAR